MKLQAKIVFIEWIDASTTHGWSSLDDLGIETCFSAGFLVRETDEDISIAAAISEHQVNATITIPKAWIKKKKVIKI